MLSAQLIKSVLFMKIIYGFALVAHWHRPKVKHTSCVCLSVCLRVWKTGFPAKVDM